MSQNNDLLSDDYKRQLQEKHSTDDQWGNTGIRHYGTLLELIDAVDAQSVLDYGCGKGLVGERFRKEQKESGNKYARVNFQEYDPGIPGKDSTDTVADVLFNTDVLEHIEPAFLDNVLSDMARRMKKAGFLLISCVPAVHRLPDGRNAHLIIEHPSWWLEKLNHFFKVGNAEFQNGELLVVVLAKDYQVSKKPAQESSPSGPVSQTTGQNQRPASPSDEKIQNALALADEGQYTKARILLSEIKNLKENPEAIYALGELHNRTNDLQKAAALYLEYAKYGDAAKGYSSAGIAFCKVENYEAALKCLQTQVCQEKYMNDPAYREALLLSLVKTNRPDAAIALYENFSAPELEQTVQYIDALILIQQLDRAHAVAEKTVQDYPDRPESWSVLERSRIALRLFDEALEASQQAVSRQPENAVYQCNLGLSYLYCGRIEDALASFNKATDLDRLMMAPYLNRSTIYRHKNDFAHLADDLHKAYEIDPASPDVHYGLGVCLLKQDQYRQAFAELEWYWHKNKLTSFRMPVTIPRWYGEDITQKTLMFYADQGVGDIIMMMRYIPDLVTKHKPRKLIINVNKKLEALFTTSFPDLFKDNDIEFFEDTVSVSAAGLDYIVAATALPHIMGTEVTNIPHTESYLKKDKTLDYKTGSDKEFVIGISWFTKSLDAGYIRSLRLMDFSFLAKFPNIRVIDLQYGDTSAERAQAAKQGFEIYHDDTVDSWTALQPFMDQVAACDLIISIDNTTVHAAGALGVPCWTILAQEPYWRWPVHGNATPWYDSLRLFRQRAKDYSHLFLEIETELKKLLAGDRDVLTVSKYTPVAQPKTADNKAVLINDTGSCYSWGNFASQQAIKDALKAQGYDIEAISTLELPWFTPQLPTLKDFDDPRYLAFCRYRDPTLFHAIQHAEQVIINGEGMMDNLSETALRLLYLAYVAKNVYGRKVSIINHSCYPEGKPSLSDPHKLAFYHKVYSRLDRCVVRDQFSYELIKSIGLDVTLGVDASLLWLKTHLQQKPIFEKNKTAIITSGAGYESRYAEKMADLCAHLESQGLQPVMLKGAKWHIAQEDYMLEQDLKELVGERAQIRSVTSPEEFVRCLAESQIVITGFYQTALMAHTLGTPALAFTTGYNGLAMAGLSKICSLPSPTFYEDPAANRKLQEAMKNNLQASPPSESERNTLFDLASKNVIFS